MASDLPHLIGALKPGEKVQLQVLRNGNSKSLSLAVGALPADGDEPLAANAAAPQHNDNRLGVSVDALSAEQKNELDIQAGDMVKSVAEGPAAMIGLRPGDVITHLNNQPITSVAQFQTVVKQLPANRSVSMRVLRQGRASFITFKLPG